MDEIIKHISLENKSWAAGLKPIDIANILNTVCMLPEIKLKYGDAVSELPACVGKTGETIVSNIISQYMPSDYILEDTSKSGYKGDFILKWQSCKTNKLYKIIIDIKNYKNTVPQKELDKFYRDIKLNYDINGGILLSLNAKIVGVSKIIDFNHLNTERGLLPITFVKSNQPDTIIEIIKLLFHTIELRDLNSNEILYKEELICTINELSDQIQNITDCRNNLQNSKYEIEKSLNSIMFSLMQCEYNLSSKIKQINKSLLNNIKIIVPDVKQTDETPAICIFGVINNVFKNSIELNYDSLLHDIYNLEWTETHIEFNKQYWILHNENFDLIIKFNKKNMSAIFSKQTDDFINIIKDHNKKYQIKSDGYHIIINPDNINLVMMLCKSYKK